MCWAESSCKLLCLHVIIQNDGLIHLFFFHPMPGQITSTFKPDPEVYVNLIKTNGRPGEFNTSFTELQKNFVKCCPAKLKNLLRLVKHWYKEYKEVSSDSYEGARLPWAWPALIWSMNPSLFSLQLATPASLGLANLGELMARICSYAGPHSLPTPTTGNQTKGPFLHHCSHWT